MSYGRNFDYPMPIEGRMARQQLARIAMDAAKLHNALQDNDDLPAWVLLKINTAEDRLHMASDYMRYKIKPGLDAYYAGAGYGAPPTQEQKDRSFRNTFLILGVIVGTVALFEAKASIEKAFR